MYLILGAVGVQWLVVVVAMILSGEVEWAIPFAVAYLPVAGGLSIVLAVVGSVAAMLATLICQSNVSWDNYHRTHRCIFYSQATMLMCLLPISGVIFFPVAQVLAWTTCTRMLARVHGIGYVRAAIAAALLPAIIGISLAELGMSSIM